jgi:hypothetical protein
MTTDDWIQFHDANIESLQIDPVGRTVIIRVQAYPNWQTRERTPVVLTFTKVRAIQSTLDFMALADHAWAGNVEQFVLAEGKGVSNLRFVEGGVVNITADKPPQLKAVPPA